MSDEVKENLKNTEVWMRLFFIFVMYLLYGAAKVVLFVLVVFQFLSTLFTGKTNANLLKFGTQLAEYIYQLVQYLTYTSDNKPFPFTEWPSGKEVKPAAKAAAAPAPAKKAPKKKAAKAEPEPEAKSEPEGGEAPEGGEEK